MRRESEGSGPPIETLHLETPRTARIVRLDPDPTAPPRELWVALHGYRQLAERFLRAFRPLARPGRRIIAPEGLARFYLGGTPGPHRGGDPVGASWMTREDREMEIRDYVRYLDRVAVRFGPGHGESPALVIVGFSQGVHTAARWIALGEAPPAHPGPVRLVLWGAALPRDLPEEAAPRFRALDALVLVRGENDPLRQPEDEALEESRLSGWGVAARVELHPGGHRVDASVLERVAAPTR